MHAWLLQAFDARGGLQHTAVVERGLHTISDSN